MVFIRLAEANHAVLFQIKHIIDVGVCSSLEMTLVKRLLHTRNKGEDLRVGSVI